MFIQNSKEQKTTYQKKGWRSSPSYIEINLTLNEPKKTEKWITGDLGTKLQTKQIKTPALRNTWGEKQPPF